MKIKNKFILAVLISFLTINAYSQANFFNKNISEIMGILNKGEATGNYLAMKKIITNSKTGDYYIEILETDKKSAEIWRKYFFDNKNQKCYSYEVISRKTNMEDNLFVINYYLITIEFNKKWRDKNNTYIVTLSENEKTYTLSYNRP